jgi:hypothetical protein
MHGAFNNASFRSSDPAFFKLIYRLQFIIPGSSVGIATDYGLDGLGIESRWGARFFAHVQTGPGAHPASCTMGTGSFPGVEAAGAWG